MKKLLILLLPLFLAACFDNSEKYDCDGLGLKINVSKATFGHIELNLCKKEGVFNIYQEGCKDKGVREFSFDTVTHHFSFSSKDIACKKIN